MKIFIVLLGILFSAQFVFGSTAQVNNVVNSGGVVAGSTVVAPPVVFPFPTAIPTLVCLYSNKTTGNGGAYHLYKNGAIYTVANGSSFNVLYVNTSQEVGAGRIGQFFSTTTTFAEGDSSFTAPVYQNGGSGFYGWYATGTGTPYHEDALYTFTGASGGSGGGTIVGYQANVTGVTHVQVCGVLTTP